MLPIIDCFLAVVFRHHPCLSFIAFSSFSFLFLLVVLVAMVVLLVCFCFFSGIYCFVCLVLVLFVCFYFRFFFLLCGCLLRSSYVTANRPFCMGGFFCVSVWANQEVWVFLGRGGNVIEWLSLI